jgi:hypothetical protein
MAKNPKDYDLENLDADLPMEYDTVELESPTSLGLIADAADRPIYDIQDLNPALLRPVGPAGYQMRIPKGTLPAVMSALDMVPPVHRADWRLHRVVAGETLADIAHHYSTAVTALTAANDHSGANAPVAGNLLVIPAVTRAPRVAAHTTAHAAARSTSHKTRSTPYHTASLSSSKRHSAVN